MKTGKKTQDIKELSVDELKDRLRNLRQELFNLNLRHGTNQLENTMQIGATKRDIARALTILRQREIAAAKQGA
jgi:large subunit ribosomal protein L29